ncbi:MAG: hypothetical protein WCE99_12765 [Nitrososphaeraceae archaeon]
MNDGVKQLAKTKRRNEIIGTDAGICASTRVPEPFVILVKAK